MTTVNDVVLIYLEDKPVSFARVEAVFPDQKKDWFQIKLLMFQVPLEVVTWILREEYLDGAQFQMNGQRMRIEKVVSPKTELSEISPSPAKKSEEKIPSAQESENKVVSLSAFRKKKE